MKKILFMFIIVISFYIMIGHVSSLVIPSDALRIRIIPNSNSEYDQEIKNDVKESIQFELYNLLKDIKGSDEARSIIENNLAFIDKKVSNTLNKYNFPYSYNINYGLNYFPEKEYKGTKYEEGYYESLVITLGEGNGDNWWCVLFPPLCLLEAEEANEVEYTSFVKELIDKYL